jgi:DNA-directed RNA polymerase
MTALGDLFSEARNTMAWLATLAHMVASEGQPMSWVTPLGLPVVQPYRKHRSFSVNTLLQHVQLNVNNDDIPVLPVRQKSAFPPNFVHSLDSTHMLMTAIEMDRMCLPFAAVHDSYWAHACNVDTMNATLRRSFVDLYSQPILENLHESLSCRFPHLEFPPVPERGELKVQDVNDSPYFFN